MTTSNVSLLKADGEEITRPRMPVVTQQTEEDAFPNVLPGIEPLGNRIMVQIRSPKKMTKGGILLSEESQDDEKWNEMTAKVVSLGPLAFKNRETMVQWPEGAWCNPGDFVRVPKWGGDRWERPFTDRHGLASSALFVIFNDHEIISKITCDPLELKTYF